MWHSFLPRLLWSSPLDAREGDGDPHEVNRASGSGSSRLSRIDLVYRLESTVRVPWIRGPHVHVLVIAEITVELPLVQSAASPDLLKDPLCNLQTASPGAYPPPVDHLGYVLMPI